MNKCVIIPGHVQMKIQQLTSTRPESKNQQLILFLLHEISWHHFKFILGKLVKYVVADIMVSLWVFAMNIILLLNKFGYKYFDIVISNVY